MRKIDLFAGTLLTTGFLSGCKAPDIGQAYIDWTTQVKPTVECNKQGQPTVVVDFKTQATNTEKVVLKATSEISGRSAEQEFTQEDSDGKQIKGGRNFKNYKYNLKGEKEEAPIQSGDLVTLRAYGIDRTGNGESELILVRPLKNAIEINVTCPNPELNRFPD